MSPRVDVTNHVRSSRKALDMTQQQLADHVGVTRQTVLSIERGRYNPSVGLALRLSLALGIPVEDLFELAGGRDDD